MICKVYAGSASWAQPGSGTWQVDGNWDPATGYPDDPADVATLGDAINSNSTISLSGTISLAAINFDNNNDYEVAFGGIDLYGNITITNTGAHTISSALELMANAEVSQGSTGDFTISGVISGAFSVTKSGANTLVLSGTNTYTGGTTVSAGILSITNDSNLGDASGGLSIGTADLYFNGLGGSFTSARTISLTGDAVIDASNGATVTVSGDISGAGSLFILGPIGNLFALSGTNTYTGGTTVSGMILEISADNNLGDSSGTVALTNQGALSVSSTFSSSRDISLTGLSTIYVANPETLTLSGVISGSGGLAVASGGTLSLTGSNIYTGETQVNSSSTLQLAGSGSISASSSLSVVSNSSFVIATGAGTKTIGSLSGESGTTVNLNNNGVIITQGSTGTYAGVISGTGGVTKSGASSLTLSGTNTYTGGTTMSEGTLSVSADANLGDSSGGLTFSGGTLRPTATFSSSRAVAISSSGTINTSLPSTTLTLSGVISGAGSLEKSGSGVLVLSGTNTYSGGTAISSGTVQVSGNAGLGDAAGAITLGGATVTVGTLNTTGTFSASRAITVPVGGTINTDDGTTLTLSGVISGAGYLVKSGLGTLILSGTNTYAGGITVSAGTLQGDTTSLQGYILNNASVVFDQAGSGTYTGNMEGTGSFVKQGAGTLNLNGLNTYTGGTTISAGIVQGGVGSLQGNIVNNATVVFVQLGADAEYSGDLSGTGLVAKTGSARLIFSGTNTYSGTTTILQGVIQGTTTSLQGDITNNAAVEFAQTSTGTYSGIMSGTGTMTKLGAGKLIMSGTNTYTGVTTVSAGELQVTGALASAPTVGASGTLSGTGTVGTTVNNGTVSPGASIGTLTIDGDYTQGAGATLVIEINPDGSSDLLDISGTATLAGTFQLNPEPGVYLGGTTYTVLTASSISGAFDTLIEDNPFTFALSYSSTAVTVSVVQSGTVLPVPIAQLKGNAKEVAKYLFCGDLTYTGDLLTVTQNITRVSPEDFPEELDQLSPAQFGALPLVSLQSDTRIATTFVEYAEKRARCQTQQELVFWAEPIGYYYKESGQGQIPFYARTFGTSFGGSKMLANDLIFSGGGAYTHSKLKWKENAGTANWDTVYVCPSIGWVPRNFYVNGLALFAFNFYNVDRDISFPGVNRTAANTHAGMDVLVRGDAGGKFRITKNGFFLQPEFRLSYLNVFENGYIETGAKSINLEVEKKNTAFIQPQCTLKWIKEWRKESRCFSPALYIGWLRNAPLTDGSYTSQFYGQTTCRPNFTVQSFHKTTDQLVLGSELLISTPRVLFVFEYEANLGYSYQVQEGKVRFNWAF